MTHYSSSLVDNTVSKLLNEIQSELTRQGYEEISGIHGLFAASLKNEEVRTNIKKFILRQKEKR